MTRKDFNKNKKIIEKFKKDNHNNYDEHNDKNFYAKD